MRSTGARRHRRRRLRDFSPSEIRRGYGDIGVKGDNAEFHLNYTAANNFVGAAASPEELLDSTLPDLHVATDDRQRSVDVSLNGSVKATDTHTLSRHILSALQAGSPRRQHSRFREGRADCDTTRSSRALGAGNDQVFDNANGNPVDFDPSCRLSARSITRRRTQSEGITLQAVEKAQVSDLPNQLVDRRQLRPWQGRLLRASWQFGHDSLPPTSEFRSSGRRLHPEI